MLHTPESILQILDACCRNYTFPMLDNGYFYLAASRMSLHRSEEDWAMVIETFGFSPREGTPSIHVYTFGSRLHNRNEAGTYVTPEAHQSYLANNPNNESRFFEPVTGEDWMDEEEQVVAGSTAVLRGQPVPVPAEGEYARAGIEIEGEQPAIFEFCRWLARQYRDDVLGTAEERRVSVPPELTQILVLEDWHHPNTVEDEVAGGT